MSFLIKMIIFISYATLVTASGPEDIDEALFISKSSLFRRDSPAAGLPTALIIGCVLGALLFLVTSVTILYFCLSRSRKPSSTPSGLPGSPLRYPFTSPEAISYPSASTVTALNPPRSDEIYPMKRVDVKTTSTTPVNGSINNASSSKNVGSVWQTRNPYYCPPRKYSSSGTKSSTSQNSKTSSSRRNGHVRAGSVAGTQTVSSISFAHATERQMELDERIGKLNGALTLLQKNAPQVVRPFSGAGSVSLAKMTHDHQVMSMKRRIDKLVQLKESEWALGLTDVLPPGLYETIAER